MKYWIGAFNLRSYSVGLTVIYNVRAQAMVVGEENDAAEAEEPSSSASAAPPLPPAAAGTPLDVAWHLLQAKLFQNHGKTDPRKPPKRIHD